MALRGPSDEQIRKANAFWGSPVGIILIILAAPALWILGLGTLATIVGSAAGIVGGAFADFYWFYLLGGLALAIWDYRRGQAIAETAKESKARAEKRAAKTESAAQTATEGAQKAMARALDIEAASLTKMNASDAKALSAMRTLPLESILRASLRIGRYPDEQEATFRTREAAFIKMRTSGWENRTSFGVGVLFLTDQQGGLCGDPSKDPSGKGCGACLYSIPLGSVHVDHIIPKSKDGTEELSNLQALCHECNVSAGNRFRRPTSAEDEDPEWDPLPERSCPDCGEDAMVRERYPAITPTVSTCGDAPCAGHSRPGGRRRQRAAPLLA